MRLGIFSRTYACSCIEETFCRMHDNALFITHLNLANAGLPIFPDEVEESDLNHILSVAKTVGIQMVSLTGTFNMVDPDKTAREKAIIQFRTQCRIAHILKIPIVTLCTGSKSSVSKWAWNPDNSLPSSYQDLLHTTEQILPYAEEYDLIFAIEPERANVINSATSANAYLNDIKCKRLKVIIDAANLFSKDNSKNMRDILLQFFDLLGNQIILAHAKDYSVSGGLHFTAPGDGILNYFTYFSLLKKYDYNGPILMHGLTEEEVPRGRDYLLNCLNTIESGGD